MNKYLITIFLFLFQSTAHSWVEEDLNIRTQDGSVDAYIWSLIVSDGTLTNNNDGTATLSNGGGSGSPGGSSTNVQYNQSGSFAGDTSFNWFQGANLLVISRDAGQSGTAIAISSDSGTSLAAISHDGATSFVTVDTGQGSNELYDMDQNVLQASSPTFSGLTLSSPLTAANGGTGNSSYTKGDILVASAATTLTKLPVGSMGQILSVDTAATTGVRWVATPTSTPGSSKYFESFPISSAKLSSDSTARLDGAFFPWRGLMADTDSERNVYLFQRRMDDNWSGGALTAKVGYGMVSSDSTSTAGGSITFSVAIMAITSGDAVSILVESFDTENSKTQQVPLTISRDDTVSIPMTNADSIAPGDDYFIRLRRVGSDSITGDAAVVNFALVEA